MFQVGDKVVCVDDSRSLILREGKTYIVEKILSPYYINVRNIENANYKSEYFISIVEDRKRKIDKICSKLEIK